MFLKCLARKIFPHQLQILPQNLSSSYILYSHHGRLVMQLTSKLNELMNEVFVEENLDNKLDIVLLLFYEIYL